MNVLLKDATGRTRLWIRKTVPVTLCQTRDLVRSLEMSVLVPGTQQLQKGSGDTVTHASDALGYLVAAEFPVHQRETFSVQHFSDIDL
jgi:ribosomal protein L18